MQVRNPSQLFFLEALEALGDLGIIQKQLFAAAATAKSQSLVVFMLLVMLRFPLV